MISGLDTSTIISQLLSADAAPQKQMKTNVSTAQLKVTAYQSVNTKMSALQTAAENVSKAATWSSAKATSSSDVATATTSSTAQPGTVSLDVTQLATGRSVLSKGTYSATDTGAKADMGYPLDVVADGKIVGTVSPSKGTLSDVVAAINKATNLGITAVAVRVGEDQYRLQITSTRTGEREGHFQLVPRTPDGTPDGATATTLDPHGKVVVPPGAESTNYDDIATAKDALATLVTEAGLASPANAVLKSSTNTFKDVLNGVDVTAAKTGQATITVAGDPDAVASAVEAFVKAANAAVDTIGIQSRAGAVGSDGKVVGGGTLRGDATLRQLKTSILANMTSALGTNVSPAAYGIQSTKDGELTFDKAKFLEGYKADPVAAQKLLAPRSVDPDSTAAGLVDRLAGIAKGATDQYTGSLTTAITGQNSTISDLTKRIADWDDRLAGKKERYQKYYSALESSLGKLKSQSSWLAGQLSSLS
ncbi:flagellar filament capping protein FliD [Kineococcus sp. TBRC 1896]|uniref:Flagellar hook-associated protein 2 n=1 Tax=Kineococcus mangrovi TaxID=1660183 RepID=A0ABV4I7L1_9ACTN